MTMVVMMMILHPPQNAFSQFVYHVCCCKSSFAVNCEQSTLYMRNSSSKSFTFDFVNVCGNKSKLSRHCCIQIRERKKETRKHTFS